MIKVFLAFALFFGLFFSLFKLSEMKIPKESRLALTKHLLYSILCAVLTVTVLTLVVIVF